MTGVEEIACKGDDGRSYTIFVVEPLGAISGKNQAFRLDDGQDVVQAGANFVAPESGLMLVPLVPLAPAAKVAVKGAKA